MSSFFSSFLKKISGTEDPPKPPPPSLSSQIFSYTKRLVLIPFPAPDLLSSLQSLITSSYSTHYKIWNLSEYNYDHFSGKCIEFLFQGYPLPHLSTFFCIFESIRLFLEQDPRNTALLHCQSTKARSFVTLAGYLLWTHSESSIHEAFGKILRLTRQEVKLLPSQSRYMNYLQSVIDGPVPKSRKLRIKKVVLEGIPVIEKVGTAVRPYLQVFKDSELVFNSHSQEYPPVSYEVEDFCVVFEMDLEVDEDVVVRCRHLGRDGQATTIFRIMFHTAFVTNDLISFNKEDLDLANKDPRFPPNFKVDFLLDSNFIDENEKFSATVIKFSGIASKENTEEVKLDKEESDEELDSYFKQLEKQ